jgi:hypothetical protein
MKLVLPLILLILSIQAHAFLQVDETLNVRLLRLSKTKQTLLTNRGLEDGLVVDMHAKFSLPQGIVARGRVVKASPSRAIWSLYRIIEEDQLVEDRVMNIKISTPMMLTDDPGMEGVRVVDPEAPSRLRPRGSRSLRRSNQDQVIMISDAESELSTEDQEELGMLEGPRSQPMIAGENYKIVSMQSIQERDWELWSLLHLNMLSGNFTTETDEGATSQSTIDFSIGFEKYFAMGESFFTPFSLFLKLHSRSNDSGDLVAVKSSFLEYGLGGNYHFYGDHLRSNNLIGFATLGIGAGQVTSGVATTNMQNGEVVSEDLSGSSSYYNIGVGAKFYLDNGFGVRAVFDYYSTSENYSFEDGEALSRNLSGPRLQAGLSFRW